MQPIPDWVPATVVAYYDDLAARVRVDGVDPGPLETLEEYYDSNKFKAGLAALQYAMYEPKMEKAWRAIEKRKETVPPATICRIVINVPSILSHFDQASDKRTIFAWKKLFDDLESAVDDFVKETGDYPTDVLMQEIYDIRTIADHWIDEWEELDSFVGQRSSPTARRTYLIRKLASQFLDLYGTPLYDTVASFAATLLDDDSIGADHVRKLVELQKKRPKSNWEKMMKYYEENPPDFDWEQDKPEQNGS